MGSGRDLTLTEPEESGQYHCRARSVHVIAQESLSPRHTVFIVPLPATGLVHWINDSLATWSPYRKSYLFMSFYIYLIIESGWT